MTLIDDYINLEMSNKHYNGIMNEYKTNYISLTNERSLGLNSRSYEPHNGT